MARPRPSDEQMTPAGNETVKLTRQAPQKRYATEEQSRIVMEGLRGEEILSRKREVKQRTLEFRRQPNWPWGQAVRRRPSRSAMYTLLSFA